MAADEKWIPDLSGVLHMSSMIADLVHYAVLHTKAETSYDQFMVGSFNDGNRWLCATPVKYPHGETEKEVLPGVFISHKKKKLKRKHGHKVDVKIPPSVLAGMKTLTRRSELFMHQRPIFTPAVDYKRNLMDEAWKLGVDILSTPFARSPSDDAPPMGIIPFASSTHDDGQLRWGRVSKFNNESLPFCSRHTPVAEGAETEDSISDSMCVSCKLFATQGPLQVYLTVTQEHEFQTKGALFHGPCLLCTRESLTRLRIAYQRGGTYAVSQGAPEILPPTQNEVDAPGGYQRKYMMLPSECPFIPVPFAKFTGTLKAKYAPIHSELYSGWYVDQGEMVVTMGSLNG
jgi:hypothetical protein